MSTASTKTPFATIDEAIDEIRAGRFVVVVDDPDRENEGDLVIAAQFATPETVNFIDAEAISKMRDGARLVNCARGELIDLDGLREADAMAARVGEIDRQAGGKLLLNVEIPLLRVAGVYAANVRRDALADQGIRSN